MLFNARSLRMYSYEPAGLLAYVISYSCSCAAHSRLNSHDVW